MNGHLVDVLVDDVVELARIVDVADTGNTYTVKYLQPLKKKYRGERVYDFSDDSECVIHFENISGYYDSADMTVAGYAYDEQARGFIRTADSDSDSDFESESGTDDDDDDDDESLVDSGLESESESE